MTTTATSTETRTWTKRGEGDPETADCCQGLFGAHKLSCPERPVSRSKSSRSKSSRRKSSRRKSSRRSPSDRELDIMGQDLGHIPAGGPVHA